MFQEDEYRFKEGESDRGNQGGINVTCTLRRIQPYKLTFKGLEEEKGVSFIRVLRQEVGWSGGQVFTALLLRVTWYIHLWIAHRLQVLHCLP